MFFLYPTRNAITREHALAILDTVVVHVAQQLHVQVCRKHFYSQYLYNCVMLSFWYDLQLMNAYLITVDVITYVWTQLVLTCADVEGATS